MQKKSKIIPGGIPFLAAGIVWFILSMLLPFYKLSSIIITAVISAVVLIILLYIRKKQLELLPPPPTIKVRVEELARKLDSARIALLEKLPLIKNAAFCSSIEHIAASLDKIADDIEKDPSDRNKVRKLANHYAPMLVELADKYLRLHAQQSAGQNIGTSMKKIEEGFSAADNAIAKLLDELFTNEAMEILADITVLDQLLQSDEDKNKIDFSSLES